MVDHATRDPRKYLLPYKTEDALYFGLLGIHDNDKAIGKKRISPGHADTD